MAIEITVPRIGWSMEEGVFSEWLKQDGDFVREGDSLFVLESEKAAQEVESFETGVLRIPPDAPQPGDTVKVGQILAFVCQQGEPVPFDALSGVKETPSTTASRSQLPPKQPDHDAKEPSSIADSRPNSACSDTAASPSVRRLARELGVNINELTASQIGHRVTVDQVQVSAARQIGTDGVVDRDGIMRFRVSPRAARAAARLGVTLSELVGTGSSGRIRERDVLAAHANRHFTAPTCDSTGRSMESSVDARTNFDSAASKPMAPSSFRQTIAVRMLAAAQETASVTLTTSADATALVSIRQQYQAALASGVSRVPSFTDLFVKLAATALNTHPALLGQWTETGIVVPNAVHVAVAVDTPLGLLAPVVRDVPSKTLQEVSEQLTSLISRARAGRLAADELCGGTFTLTNLGGYRVDSFTPLLNLPQSAILGIGRIAPQSVAVNGRSVVRDRVTLSLTFDHRVVDGATAAALLTSICELFENPIAHLMT